MEIGDVGVAMHPQIANEVVKLALWAQASANANANTNALEWASGNTNVTWTSTVTWRNMSNTRQIACGSCLGLDGDTEEGSGCDSGYAWDCDCERSTNGLSRSATEIET